MNFNNPIYEDALERWSDFEAETLRYRTAEPEGLFEHAQNVGRQALQGGANALGAFVLDPMGHAITEGLDLVTPEPVQEKFKEGVGAVMETEPVQGLMTWAANNPDDAKVAGYAMDLAEVIPAMRAQKSAGRSFNAMAHDTPTHVRWFYQNNPVFKALGMAEAFGKEGVWNAVKTNLTPSGRASARQGINTVNRKEITGWMDAVDLIPSIDAKMEQLLKLTPERFLKDPERYRELKLTPEEISAVGKLQSLPGSPVGILDDKGNYVPYSKRANPALSYVDGQLGTQYSIAAQRGNVPEILKTMYEDTNLSYVGKANGRGLSNVFEEGTDPAVIQNFQNHVKAHYLLPEGARPQYNNNKTADNTIFTIREPKTGSASKGGGVDLQREAMIKNSWKSGKMYDAFGAGNNQGVLKAFDRAGLDVSQEDIIRTVRDADGNKLASGGLENYLNASAYMDNKDAAEYTMLAYKKANDIPMTPQELLGKADGNKFVSNQKVIEKMQAREKPMTSKQRADYDKRVEANAAYQERMNRGGRFAELDNLIANPVVRETDGRMYFQDSGPAAAKELGGVNNWTTVVVDPDKGKVGSAMSIITDKHDILGLDPAEGKAYLTAVKPIQYDITQKGASVVNAGAPQKDLRAAAAESLLNLTGQERPAYMGPAVGPMRPKDQAALAAQRPTREADMLQNLIRDTMRDYNPKAEIRDYLGVGGAVARPASEAALLAAYGESGRTASDLPVGLMRPEEQEKQRYLRQNLVGELTPRNSRPFFNS